MKDVQGFKVCQGNLIIFPWYILKIFVFISFKIIIIYVYCNIHAINEKKL